MRVYALEEFILLYYIHAFNFLIINSQGGGVGVQA